MNDNLKLEFWYRYYNYAYRAGEGVTRISVELAKLPVVRRTPKGMWVMDEQMKERFVRTSAYKKYAYPTREEALRAYRWRKFFEIQFLYKRLNNAKRMLFLAAGNSSIALIDESEKADQTRRSFKDSQDIYEHALERVARTTKPVVCGAGPSTGDGQDSCSQALCPFRVASDAFPVPFMRDKRQICPLHDYTIENEKGDPFAGPEVEHEF